MWEKVSAFDESMLKRCQVVIRRVYPFVSSINRTSAQWGMLYRGVNLESYESLGMLIAFCYQCLPVNREWAINGLGIHGGLPQDACDATVTRLRELLGTDEVPAFYVTRPTPISDPVNEEFYVRLSQDPGLKVDVLSKTGVFEDWKISLPRA